MTRLALPTVPVIPAAAGDPNGPGGPGHDSQAPLPLPALSSLSMEDVLPRRSGDLGRFLSSLLYHVSSLDTRLHALEAVRDRDEAVSTQAADIFARVREVERHTSETVSALQAAVGSAEQSMSDKLNQNTRLCMSQAGRLLTMEERQAELGALVNAKGDRREVLTLLRDSRTRSEQVRKLLRIATATQQEARLRRSGTKQQDEAKDALEALAEDQGPSWRVEAATLRMQQEHYNEQLNQVCVVLNGKTDRNETRVVADVMEQAKAAQERAERRADKLEAEIDSLREQMTRAQTRSEEQLAKMRALLANVSEMARSAQHTVDAVQQFQRDLAEQKAEAPAAPDSPPQRGRSRSPSASRRRSQARSPSAELVADEVDERRLMAVLVQLTGLGNNVTALQDRVTELTDELDQRQRESDERYCLRDELNEVRTTVVSVSDSLNQKADKSYLDAFVGSNSPAPTASPSGTSTGGTTVNRDMQMLLTSKADAHLVRLMRRDLKQLMGKVRELSSGGGAHGPQDDDASRPGMSLLVKTTMASFRAELKETQKRLERLDERTAGQFSESTGTLIDLRRELLDMVAQVNGTATSQTLVTAGLERLRVTLDGKIESVAKAATQGLERAQRALRAELEAARSKINDRLIDLARRPPMVGAQKLSGVQLAAPEPEARAAPLAPPPPGSGPSALVLHGAVEPLRQEIEQQARDLRRAREAMTQLARACGRLAGGAAAAQGPKASLEQGVAALAAGAQPKVNVDDLAAALARVDGLARALDAHREELREVQAALRAPARQTFTSKESITANRSGSVLIKGHFMPTLVGSGSGSGSGKGVSPRPPLAAPSAPSVPSVPEDAAPVTMRRLVAAPQKRSPRVVKAVSQPVLERARPGPGPGPGPGSASVAELDVEDEAPAPTATDPILGPAEEVEGGEEEEGEEEDEVIDSSPESSPERRSRHRRRSGEKGKRRRRSRSKRRKQRRAAAAAAAAAADAEAVAGDSGEGQ